MPTITAATPCIAIRRAGTVIVQNCNSDYNNTGGGTSNQKSIAVSATLVLTAGQQIDVRFFTVAGGTTQPTFLTTAGTNYLVVKRVGNAALVSSDRRLKQNIESFTGGLDEILGINTVTFQYNGQAA